MKCNHCNRKLSCETYNQYLTNGSEKYLYCNVVDTTDERKAKQRKHPEPTTVATARRLMNGQSEILGFCV